MREAAYDFDRPALVHRKVPDIPMFLGPDGVSVGPTANVVAVACRLAELAGQPETSAELARAYFASLPGADNFDFHLF